MTRPAPRYPALLEINTRVWLRRLSREAGSPVTLASVDDAVLDDIARLGFDWIWLLSVWRTGAAGRAVSRDTPASVTGCSGGDLKREVPIADARSAAPPAQGCPHPGRQGILYRLAAVKQLYATATPVSAASYRGLTAQKPSGMLGSPRTLLAIQATLHWAIHRIERWLL